MPRFFLHLRAGDTLIEDAEGSVLPDLDAARSLALRGARDILAAKIKAGEVLDHERVEITDETGRVLATLPLREAIRLS